MLGALKRELPIPSSLVQHYGSVVGFVEAVPALEWAEPLGTANVVYKNHVCLVPVPRRVEQASNFSFSFRA
jgi:hypothetical protein